MVTREVASGVVNLGNTCYMNAVFQALAHTPELCMAVECEPHRKACPIALSNAKHKRQSDNLSTSTIDNEDGTQFCLLCEIEKHLIRAHSGPMSNFVKSTTKSNGDLQRNESIAPSTLVNGFFNYIANDNFTVGRQQDSHEFLRLLIDGMQNSCIEARQNDKINIDMKMEEDNLGDEVFSQDNELSHQSGGKEYAFRLFRGTVESTIRCSLCGSSSIKIDPIEDVGLEVTSKHNGDSLCDITSALKNFIEEEKLDSYTCEKCNVKACATKTTRLASIPPILTLHLKRFAFRRNSHTSSHTFSSRRLHGSQKIEGFVKFEQVLDIYPYVTMKCRDEMKINKKKMFCRLFAVVVHSGKNSHSGHYIAYVRSLSKNEWWKMDDAKVTRVAQEEVVNCEAYMLFYRVVEHPISIGLRKAEASMKEKALQKDVKLTEDKQCETKMENEDTDHQLRTKRKRNQNESEFTSSRIWAQHSTKLPEDFISVLENAEDVLSHIVDFNSEYFRLIKDEAEKTDQFGGGPNIVLSIDENVRNVEVYKKAIWDLIAQCTSNYEGNMIKLLNTKVSGSPL